MDCLFSHAATGEAASGQNRPVGLPAAMSRAFGHGLINTEPQAVRFRSEADMNRPAKPAGSVELTQR